MMQEHELIQLAKTDRKALVALWEQKRCLGQAMLWRWCPRAKQEHLGMTWLAIIEAVKTFDPSMSEQFNSWFLTWIRCEIAHFYRNGNLVRVPHRKWKQFKAQFCEFEEPHESSASCNWIDDYIDLMQAAEMMSDRKQEAIALQLEGNSQTDAARILGVSHQRIEQINRELNGRMSANDSIEVQRS